jgi:transposase
MMGSVRGLKVWVYPTPTDMRRSFDSLRSLAREGLGRDVVAGDLVLFIGRSRHTAKVLFWDGTGLCLYAKRLEKGLFNAPWLAPTRTPWTLTLTELQLFLEGCRLIGLVPISPPAYAM